MKKLITSFLLLSLSVLAWGQGPEADHYSGISGFRHPGCLHRESDFDRIRKDIKSHSRKGVTDTWEIFKDNDKVRQTDFFLASNPGIRYLERSGSGGNFSNSHRDFGTCYVKAIYWKLMHDSSDATEAANAKRYADDAVRIFNCYAKQIVGIRGDSNYALLTGFQGWELANAAEILRDYEGWSRNDYNRFKQWMVDVWATSAYDFLYRQNENCDSHYQSNWNTSVITSLQAIAIFLDDPFLFNYAMMQIKQGYTNASLNPDVIGTGGVPTKENGYTDYHGFLPYIYNIDEYNAEHGTHYQSPLGVLCQNQENTRDQAHAQGALGTQEQTCEQAWNQGDDLWDYNNRVMAGGVEYCAGWLSAAPTDSAFMKGYPWGKWESDCGNSHDQQQISHVSRESKDPIFQISYNHFANRMGLNMPYAKKQHASLGGVEVGAGHLSFSDHAGYGDMMHNEDSALVHPTVITGHITMLSGGNEDVPLGKISRTSVKKTAVGATYTFPGMSNITKGSVVRLEGVITDGSEDTGNWEWEDAPGIRSRQREVTVSGSRLLRVYYTNAEGATSCQLFVLHCKGEGYLPTVRQYYVKNGVNIYGENTISVKSGSAVNLGVETNSIGMFLALKWQQYNESAGTWTTLTSGLDKLQIPSTRVTRHTRIRCVMTANFGADLELYYDISPSTMVVTAENGKDFSDEGTMYVEQGTAVRLTAASSRAQMNDASASREFCWLEGTDTLQHHWLTGKEVTDTLRITSITHPADIRLFETAQDTSGDVYSDSTNFSLRLFRRNPLANGYYFITESATGRYLNCESACFESFDSETSDAGKYLWHFVKTVMYADEHYLISPITDANRYLNASGKLQAIVDAGILMDVMQSAEDEMAHTLRSIDESLFKPLGVDEYSNLIVESTSRISSFPFCIQKYKGDITEPLLTPDVNTKYLLESVKALADRIGCLEQRNEYQTVANLLEQNQYTTLEGKMAMLKLRKVCRESMTLDVLNTATATMPIDLTCFIKNPNISQNLLDASGNPSNATVEGWNCDACADGHERTEQKSGNTWLYCYSWSGNDAHNIASTTDYWQEVGADENLLSVDLPSGMYRLEAATFAASGSDRLQLYARTHDGTVKTTKFNGLNSAWDTAQKGTGTTTKVHDIDVTNGRLRIGIKGNGVVGGNGRSWRADNFRLYFIKATEATGVEAPTPPCLPHENDAAYNIFGMKVHKNYKGLVIKNGHKYIQK